MGAALSDGLQLFIQRGLEPIETDRQHVEAAMRNRAPSKGIENVAPSSRAHRGHRVTPSSPNC